MSIINNLELSYPDFQLNQIIDPEQFDINNAEIVAKINEIASQLNITTEVELPELIVLINTALSNKASIDYVDTSVADAVIGQLPEGSVTDSYLSNSPTGVKARVAALQELTGPFRVDRLNKDSEGIFTEIRYIRKDVLTLYRKTVLSGGTSPQYTTLTETYYGPDGVTVSNQQVYSLLYDVDGDLTVVEFAYPLGQ